MRKRPRARVQQIFFVFFLFYYFYNFLTDEARTEPYARYSPPELVFGGGVTGCCWSGGERKKVSSGVSISVQDAIFDTTESTQQIFKSTQSVDPLCGVSKSGCNFWFSLWAFNTNTTFYKRFNCKMKIHFLPECFYGLSQSKTRKNPFISFKRLVGLWKF